MAVSSTTVVQLVGELRYTFPLKRNKSNGFGAMHINDKKLTIYNYDKGYHTSDFLKAGYSGKISIVLAADKFIGLLISACEFFEK